jgi:hypothetical protein
MICRFAAMDAVVSFHGDVTETKDAATHEVASEPPGFQTMHNSVSQRPFARIQFG